MLHDNIGAHCNEWFIEPQQITLFIFPFPDLHNAPVFPKPHSIIAAEDPLIPAKAESAGPSGGPLSLPAAGPAGEAMAASAATATASSDGNSPDEFPSIEVGLHMTRFGRAGQKYKRGYFVPRLTPAYNGGSAKSWERRHQAHQGKAIWDPVVYVTNPVPDLPVVATEPAAPLDEESESTDGS